jgi:hypothetical protein
VDRKERASTRSQTHKWYFWKGKRRTITSVGELLVRGIGTFRISALRTNGTHYSRALKVGDICLWWVRIITWFANIIDVKVSDFRKWTFDVVVASIVRILTRRVASCDRSAFLEKWQAIAGISAKVRCMLRGSNQRSVSVVVAEVDISFVLNDGIVPAIIDPQSN